MIQFTNKRGLAGQASHCCAAITEFRMRNLKHNDLVPLDIPRFEDGCHSASVDERLNFKPVVKKIANLEFATQTCDITRFDIKKSLT
jgi:hypothetical protein